MICWVTAPELPGLLLQNVIVAAGFTPEKSTFSTAAGPPPGAETVGPPQAASAAVAPTAPVRRRKPRRSRSGRRSEPVMRGPILGGMDAALVLHRALGEPGDDVALQGDEDDQHGHDDRDRTGHE